MAFTSVSFLAFIAVLFAVYYIVPLRFRWIALLAFSVVFYALSGFLQYIAVTAATTYLASLILEKKRSRLTVALWCFVNLGMLAAVKFPFTGLLMPLGISFYTFQSAGYILDVYRRKADTERNPLKLTLFVTFFPQIIQGPISRFGVLSKELFAPRPFAMINVSEGLQRIIWGYFKKLVIADRLLPAVLLMSGDPAQYGGLYVLCNIVLYAVVLYADFTGGIDITIGIARFFGISVTENFDKPFYAKNIADYWRRWHITMGSWFRDYLFYPLSVGKPMRRFSKLSRKTLGEGFGRRLPVYIVTIITWFATGLWHGTSPNFIAWGLVNGFVIIFSQECEPLYKRFRERFAVHSTKGYQAFAVVRTFLLMCMIRSFDIYGGVGRTFTAMLSMFMPWKTGELSSIGVTAADMIVAAIAVALVIAAGLKLPREWYFTRSPTIKLGLCLLLCMVILVFGVYGYGYDARQFIYNQF